MLRLTLTSDERIELEHARDRHPIPYMRERASAILKVSSDLSCRQVALGGLGKRRRVETILRWVRRYAVDRTLPKQKLRRRSFSPDGPEYRDVLDILHRSPEQFGHQCATWKVEHIRATALPHLTSYSGAYKRLRRWKIAKKQTRLHINSPDPFYIEKQLAILTVFQNALAEPDKYRLIYADEASFYRQPTMTRCFSPSPERPLATWDGGANTNFRICAGLDAVSASVVATVRSKFATRGHCKWLRVLRDTYGPDVNLCVAWDNWPIHSHEDVVAVAENLGIQLLSLPTYAPWTNPIEKLWRLMRQTLCHMHGRQAKADWPAFKEKPTLFLKQFEQPSEFLLNYVGLANRKCTH